MGNHYIPNTAAIPNVLFDYWMNKLSPAEFKVLMCIARKTYGFHKGVDRISLAQIRKMTGLSVKGIIQNIETLIGHKLVNKLKSKTADGDDAANQYEINLQCVTPTEENCMGGGSELSSVGGSELSTLGVLNSVQTQNTTYKTQEIQTPPNPQPTPAKDDAADAAEVESSFSSKSKREKSDFPPKVRDLGNQMINSLTRIKANYVPPKNLTAFLTEVEFMIRLDKRDPVEVLDVFNWAVADSFWADKMFKPNPAKYLREKYDQLEMKMKAKPAPKANEVDRRYRDKDGNTVDDWKDRLF